MGAAWVTSACVLPLIIEPINYKTVGIIQEPTQIEKLLNENSLDRIKDIVQEELQIPQSLIKSDRWTVKKREFLSRIKRHISANPFQVPMDRDAFNRLQKENVELSKTVDNLIEEKAGLEDLIEDLERVKDKVEVKKVLKKHKPNSDYDEFSEVAKKAKKQLQNFSPIMRGIIFKEYTGKDLRINWEHYRGDIDEAVAEDFVTDDLDVDWETTQEMQNIYESMNEISEILGRNLSESFDAYFKKDYKSPMKLDNKSFWENVFDVSIYF